MMKKDAHKVLLWQFRQLKGIEKETSFLALHGQGHIHFAQVFEDMFSHPLIKINTCFE